jgi:putative spermidine/putrescine transport system ATP-binding protein
VVRLPPHKRNIGMVFQNYALFPHMNVAENIAFPLQLRKMSKSEQEIRVRKALDMVQLPHMLERRPDQLSGGQRQRVAFARAIVFQPDVMLMDEPLSALDKNLRDAMQIEIRNLHARLGMTVVYVTHDQREALTISDRVAVLKQGRIEQIGTPQELYERPTTRFVAEFVGETSFIPVTIEQGVVVLAGKPMRTATPVTGLGREAALAIRPEKLIVISGPVPHDMNVIIGSVDNLVYQGDSLLIQVLLESGTRLAIRQPTRRDIVDSLPTTGAPILLGIHPQDTIVVGAA